MCTMFADRGHREIITYIDDSQTYLLILLIKYALINECVFFFTYQLYRY